MDDNPALSGLPIILIHLEDPIGSGLAACCAQPFFPHDVELYRYIPKVPCEGCIIATESPIPEDFFKNKDD